MNNYDFVFEGYYEVIILEFEDYNYCYCFCRLCRLCSLYRKWKKNQI